jgi:type III pantothenate kinase
MTTKRWLLDLGNTRLKMAPLHKGARGEVTALPHADDDFEVALRSYFDAHDADEAWLASVAPPDTDLAPESLLQDMGLEVQRVQTRASAGQAEDRLRRAGAPGRRPLPRAARRQRARRRPLAGGFRPAARSRWTCSARRRAPRRPDRADAIADALGARHALRAARRAEGQALDFATDTAEAIASGARAPRSACSSTAGAAPARNWAASRPCWSAAAAPSCLLQADVPHAQAAPALVLDGMAAYVKEARP